MFKRKKKKTGIQTPEFRKPTPPPMPPVKPAKPEVKEFFENYKNIIIVPRHDKIDTWKDADYLPYKDEILIAYNDIKVIYKLGDGIHGWNDLPESTLEEVLAFGYVYNTTYGRYKIKLEFIPTRTMRTKENNKCKD